MKQTKIVLLIFLLFLPFITIQIYNNKYTTLEDKICAMDKAFMGVCDYSERFERYATLSTNFYRYLGEHFGRPMGTSPPFTYSLRAVIPQVDDASSNAKKSKAAILAGKVYEAERELGKFNKHLFLSFTISVVVASVAATLLVQKIHRRKN